MKVVAFVKANADTEGGVMPTTGLVAAMGAYNQELVDAGIMQGGDGLKPTSQGRRVVFTGDRRTVLDGPFTETKELIAGYWLWTVRDLDEAVAWARRCPNPTGDQGVLEIRPVYEMEDFGEAVTPELKAQYDHQRATLDQRAD